MPVVQVVSYDASAGWKDGRPRRITSIRTTIAPETDETRLAHLLHQADQLRAKIAQRKGRTP
ncbi:MAG: hypothetical protein ABSB49_09780 [Polyangia bacterium]